MSTIYTYEPTFNNDNVEVHQANVIANRYYAQVCITIVCKGNSSNFEICSGLPQPISDMFFVAINKTKQKAVRLFLKRTGHLHYFYNVENTSVDDEIDIIIMYFRS